MPLKAPRRRVDGPKEGGKKEGRSSARGQARQRDKNNRRDVVETPSHLEMDFMPARRGLHFEWGEGGCENAYLEPARLKRKEIQRHAI